MIVWGTNLPMTRSPDAHFFVESRYAGTKVAAVAPDFAEYVKFADTWLPARAGTDGALALAMTFVILKEFYLDRQSRILHPVCEAVHRPSLRGRAETEQRAHRSLCFGPLPAGERSRQADGKRGMEAGPLRPADGRFRGSPRHDRRAVAGERATGTCT